MLTNFREAKREVKIKIIFGMEDRILSQREPFLLEDVWGVTESCYVVWHLLDTGKNSH